MAALLWAGLFFFAAEKSEKEKSMQKKEKTNTQKNLKKEQKKEKKEPAVYATAGSMLKKCFVKA